MCLFLYGWYYPGVRLQIWTIFGQNYLGRPQGKIWVEKNPPPPYVSFGLGLGIPRRPPPLWEFWEFWPFGVWALGVWGPVFPRVTCGLGSLGLDSGLCKFGCVWRSLKIVRLRMVYIRNEPEGKNAKGKHFAEKKKMFAEDISKDFSQKIEDITCTPDFRAFLDIFEIFAEDCFLLLQSCGPATQWKTGRKTKMWKK